jgi:hypothetical protein
MRRSNLGVSLAAALLVCAVPLLPAACSSSSGSGGNNPGGGDSSTSGDSTAGGDSAAGNDSSTGDDTSQAADTSSSSDSSMSSDTGSSGDASTDGCGCGVCQECSDGGTCTDVPSGQTTAQCLGVNACNASGQCLLIAGQSCTMDAQCVSNMCMTGGGEAGADGGGSEGGTGGMCL